MGTLPGCRPHLDFRELAVSVTAQDVACMCAVLTKYE